jgi:hypothetical protein
MVKPRITLLEHRSGARFARDLEVGKENGMGAP